MPPYVPPDYSDDPLVVAVSKAPNAAAVSALLFANIAEPSNSLRVQAALRVAPALELGLVWALLNAGTYLDALAASPALTPALRQQIRRHYTHRLDHLKGMNERSALLLHLATFAPAEDDPEAVAQTNALWARCTPKSRTARVNRTHEQHATTFLSSTVGVTPARLGHLAHHFWDNARIVTAIVNHAAATPEILDALFRQFEARRADPSFSTDWRLRGARVRFLSVALRVPSFRQDSTLLPRWWALALFTPLVDDRAHAELLGEMAAMPFLPDRVLAMRACVSLQTLPLSAEARAKFFVRADIRPAIDHALAETLLSDPCAEIRQSGIFALAQPDPGVPPLADLPPWTAPDVWAECRQILDKAAADAPRGTSSSRYSHLMHDVQHIEYLHDLRDRWTAQQPTTEGEITTALDAMPSVREVLLPPFEMARRFLQLRRTLIRHHPTIPAMLATTVTPPAVPARRRR